MNMHVTAQHVMQIMDPTGHTTVTWNPDNEASVADARREFNRLRGEGYSAFAMDIVHENGCVTERQGTRVDRFDPHVGKMIMVPQLVGG